jgi:hypothetical protein
MTQEQHRRGTAAVALRRLVHPGQDGGLVGEDDQLSEVTRRLSELLAVVEQRTAEIDDRAATSSAASVASSGPCEPLPRRRTTTQVRPRSACASIRKCSPVSTPPLGALGSAAQRGCTLLQESSWGTDDNLFGVSECDIVEKVVTALAGGWSLETKV